MKITSLILLALFLAACTPAAPAAPTAPLASNPAGAAAAPPADATPTAAPVPAVTFTATLVPTATETPAPTPTASATPFTAPVILNRYPLFLADGLGYGSALLALPGGQVWEATSGGGLRVYDSASLKVVKSLDLGVKGKQFTRLVGDEQYVWALFFSPLEGPDPARLFRISRADYSYQPVSLPGACTYEDCLWSYVLVDQNILWVGGYDELLGIDRGTLQPVVRFLFSEQAQVFLPAQVQDLDVTDGGQVWALFCTDVCYIVLLDRQKLLDNQEQEPPKIYFENNSLQFVARLGGTMWAAESGNADEQPAVLYPLSGEDIDRDLSPTDGVELPGELDFMEISGNGNVSDGKYLWVRDEGGRKLFWFDPVKREVAGVLEVYPGSEPSAADPNVMMSLSFDGQFLWTGGTEILRIALPWVSR